MSDIQTIQKPQEEVESSEADSTKQEGNTQKDTPQEREDTHSHEIIPSTPAKSVQKKSGHKPDTLLVACKKFQYIGDVVYTFKDGFGYTYQANPNQVLIVPIGALTRHFKAKKLYFKEL